MSPGGRQVSLVRHATGVSALLKSPWKATLLVILAYAGLVLAVTYPQILELGQRTLGEPGVDKQNHLWDIWWFFRAAGDPDRTFFFSDWLYYPPGVSLWAANSGFTKYFLGLIPLSLGLSVPATYNLLVMFSMVVSGVGGHLVGVRLFERHEVGLFMGVTAAFNPLVIYHLGVSLPEFINLGWAMLFVAALYRLGAEPSPRVAAQALLWFVLTATWCWYMGLMLVLFSAVYLPLVMGPRRVLKLQRRQALVFIVWILAVGLFMGYFSLKMGVGGVEDRMAAVDQGMMVGMGDRVTPVQDKELFLKQEAARLGVNDLPCLQALESKLAAALDPWSALTASSTRHRMALFFPMRWGAPLLLALAGILLVRRRWVLACAGILLVSTLLALGPCLVMGDQIRWGSCAMMPFSLAAELVGGIRRIQFPLRLLFPAVLALILLAGGGLNALLERLGPGPWRRAVLVLSATVFTLGGGLSTVDFDLIGEQLDVPAFYSNLAREGGDFAVAEIPISRGPGVKSATIHSFFTFYQTIHGKRIMGGPMPEYLAPGVHARGLAGNALLARILEMEWGATEQPSQAELRGALAAGLTSLKGHGYRYIVVHPRTMDSVVAEAIITLLQRLAGPPLKDLSLEDDPLHLFYLGPVEVFRGGS